MQETSQPTIGMKELAIFEACGVKTFHQALGFALEASKRPTQP